jgi:hypothetical protein
MVDDVLVVEICECGETDENEVQGTYNKLRLLSAQQRFFSDTWSRRGTCFSLAMVKAGDGIYRAGKLPSSVSSPYAAIQPRLLSRMCSSISASYRASPGPGLAGRIRTLRVSAVNA